MVVRRGRKGSQPRTYPFRLGFTDDLRMTSIASCPVVVYPSGLDARFLPAAAFAFFTELRWLLRRSKRPPGPHVLRFSAPGLCS